MIQFGNEIPQSLARYLMNAIKERGLAVDSMAVQHRNEIEQLFESTTQCGEAEYLAADTNLLIEFVDGNIQVLPMPTDHHQAIVAFLFEALLLFVRPRQLGTVRFAALKVRLREGKYREPDLLFIRTQNDAKRLNAYWMWADLVMEVVSEDNRLHDLQTKRIEYAKAGIPEYWIVDPQLEEVTVLRLTGDSYEQDGVHRRGERAKSLLLPGFEVDVTAVFEAQ